jgi:hypothetical protein
MEGHHAVDALGKASSEFTRREVAEAISTGRKFTWSRQISDAKREKFMREKFMDSQHERAYYDRSDT